MRKWIRESVIRISKAKYTTLIVFVIDVILLMLAAAFGLLHFWIFTWLVMCIGECLKVIAKSSESIIEQNKLTTIVLSDRTVCFDLIFIPITAIAVTIYLPSNPFGDIIWGIVIVIPVIVLSQKLSDFFKKRLIR